MPKATKGGLRLTAEALAQRDIDPEQVQATLARFHRLMAAARTDDEARAITRQIAKFTRRYRIMHGIGLPKGPAQQALELDPQYVLRPHVELLSERIVQAVEDVENGQNRQIAISMPPRAGKSTLTSMYSPLWMLRRHPEWDIVMTSFDGGLIKGWARGIRHYIEDRPSLGIALQRDGGAGGRWTTEEGGGMYTVGIGGALTGRGAKVLIIDDPVSDFAAAHSPRIRQNLWDWWLSVAQTRLEPPYLVLVVMTRWHEDDFVGRLFSEEHEGRPKDWERIVLPAIAEKDDVLGRQPGEPLISPLLDENPMEAQQRWAATREQVGTYTFEAMYQQHPAPQKGAIFDAGWWRYWTIDPTKATEDGRVVYLDPSTLIGGQWIDSWDLNFDASESGSFVVGQRWVRHMANRFLIDQKRGRWNFTSSIKEMEAWGGVEPDDWDEDEKGPFDPWNPNVNFCGKFVHTRLVEKKANGAAALAVLRDKISGLKPINPRTSKELRARAVTPEIESGNVYLPHPSDPGNDWVTELLSELRNFPHDAHDDQVDTLTQALNHLRGVGKGGITRPTDPKTVAQASGGRSVTRAAQSDLRKRRDQPAGRSPLTRTMPRR